MSDSTDLDAFRASAAQLRMYALAAERGCDAFVVQAVASLPDEADRAALAERVAAVTRRYEIVRTSLRVLPGMSEAAQVIDEPADGLCGADEDLSTAATAERAHSAVSGRVRFAASSRHVLVTAPAWCLDSASAVLLLGELAREPGASAEAPLQFADVAEWQHAVLEEATATGTASAAPPAMLPTPLGKPPARPGAFAPAFVACPALPPLPAERAEAFLLTCWRTVLSRIAGTPVTVAVSCNGRIEEELRAVPGPFSRLLPLPGEAGLATTVAGEIEAVASALSAMRAEQDRTVLGAHLGQSCSSTPTLGRAARGRSKESTRY